MAKDEPGFVDSANMTIYNHGDGTASYTGSLNVAEWGDFLKSSGLKARAGYELADDADQGTEPPAPQSASEATVLDPTTGEDGNPAATEQPAGNASADEWRAYAVSQGASEDEVADMSRNELREQYGSEG